MFNLPSFYLFNLKINMARIWWDSNITKYKYNIVKTIIYYFYYYYYLKYKHNGK